MTEDTTAVAGADVAPAAFSDLGPGQGPGEQAPIDLLSDVELDVTVELGRVKTAVRDLLALRAGSVLELSQPTGAPVEVLANGTPIAKGEVVVVGDELGVRITQILKRA